MERTFFEGSISGTVVHNAKTSSFYGMSTELRSGRTDVSLSGGLRYSFPAPASLDEIARRRSDALSFRLAG